MSDPTSIQGTPPGVPPQSPKWPAPAAEPRETRGVAFVVAIFLGILLVASAGLNVLLLFVSVGSVAGGGLGSVDGTYEKVHAGGERGADKKVLRVSIHGAIAESASPLMGAGGGTVSLVERALRQAEQDQVHGILLDIDSPGGGVTDSDEIYRMIRKYREKHPDVKVASLFGDISASGGYYVAAASERIFARRTTITGSIGVIMSSYNFAKLAQTYGVEEIAIKSDRTPMKDILSTMRPMRDDEKALLTGIVDELFDQFVSVVDEGRPNLDREQVLKAATGAVYTASQAQQLGLVDEIGDLDGTLAWFEGQLGGKVELVELRRRPGLGDLLFGGAAASSPDLAAQLLLQSSGPRFLYFWQGGR
jgi:protease-4